MGFDPASLAIMATVASAAGTAVSADSAYNSAEAKSAQSAYQAQVAANNAQIAQTDARLDIQSGEATAVNQGMKTRAAVGQEKAAQGAAGIDVNTGSAVNVRAGTEATGMLDALTLRSNAAKAAYAQEVQANADTNQGQLYQAESTQEAEAAPLSAFGTLLSGASSTANSYGKYLQTYGSSSGPSSGTAAFNSGSGIY